MTNADLHGAARGRPEARMNSGMKRPIVVILSG
jgi:hypothetical protein